MASRKKQPDTQASLFAAAPVIRPEAGHGVGDQFGGEDFPTFTAPPIDANERPKLRLVPPPEKLPESEVIIEKVGEVFEVSLLRDHGTTVAAVFYTRKQLEQLIARAKGALDI